MRLDAGALFQLGWRYAHRVPAPLLVAAGTIGADLMWLARTDGVRQLERNLRRVRPTVSERDLRALSRRAMRSYMRYYREAFVLRGATQEQIRARVRVVGYENCAQFVDEGVTPVVALGHQGNWDLAGVFASTYIAPVVTVAERLEPPTLYEEFKGFREDLGMEILTAGDPGLFRALIRAARGRGRLVCLLGDRDLGRNGVEVELVGHRARVAPGPAALALSCGAPLLPAGVWYERLTGARRRAAGSAWGIVIRFHPPVPVPEEGTTPERIRVLSQGWVDAISTNLAQHPEDWHMLQKVFVADLDPARYAATRASSPTGAEGTAP